MIQEVKEWLMEKWDNTPMKTKMFGGAIILILIVVILA